MYFKPTFLLLLVLLPLLAFSAPTEDQEWEEFKGKYNKHYKDKSEEQKRHNLFKERAKKIAKHNDEHAKGKHSYSLKINHLADKTDAELRMMMGIMLRLATPKSVELQTPFDRQTPSSVDLRNDKCMPAIKNQASCGSCWAFAATNVMEYANCKKKKLSAPVLLSEQNLVDCTYDYDGCEGGFYSEAWENINNVVSGASYPYVSGKTETWNGICKYASSSQVAHVKTFNYLSTVSAMEQALSNGPLAVAMFAEGDKFSFYSDGIYSDSVTCDPVTINSTITHAVNIVGYNNNNNPPYWILRNSYDTTWGTNGYMTIQKGINLCNIEKYAYGNVQLV